MGIFYSLSIIYIFILFLLYRKSDKKNCFLSSIIYTIGILFCYNTFIVYVLYLLKIDGSMLIYSLINYMIGSFLLVIILKKRKIQMYYLDRNKFFAILGLVIIIFLICYFRFEQFRAINYESGDAAIHYRHALEFSKELTILDENNSQDDVFNYFKRVMPISYINCGFLFNIFFASKTYLLFSYYNTFVLIMSSLVFFITIIDVFKDKGKNYLFALVLSLFYILAFPLNNFMLGFCYLSLSIMVINLLFLVIFKLKDNFSEGIIFKVINIFLLTFSVFYSYYLFVPAVYLSLGIYYILLWKKGNINFKKIILYGVITLVIPFVMGFCYFLVTLFVDEGVGMVAQLINLWGYSYNNVTPMYLFVFVLGYLIFKFKGKKKYNYLEINICSVTLYVALFLILYIMRLADLYYFYKLFALYWLIIILFFASKIMQYKFKFYILMIIICISSIFICKYYATDVAQFIGSTNIYSWNASVFDRDDPIYDQDELELLEKSMDYEDICVYNDRFLMMGSVYKNVWYYSITDHIPTYINVDGDYTKFNQESNSVPSFVAWDTALLKYDCLVYYYEGNNIEIDDNKYEILYQNASGSIIKRKK